MAAPQGTTPGNLGAKGQEQFANAQIQIRNFALEAYIASLMLFRTEYLGDDQLETRNGFDDPTLMHFKEMLAKCDETRRLGVDVSNTLIDVKVLFPDLVGQSGNVTAQSPGAIGAQGTTNNPTSTAGAPGTGGALTTGGTPPVIRPNTKRPAAPLRSLRWALDGSDPNIPLNSQINIRNPLATVILGMIDKAITDATRCEDRFLTNYITPETAVLLYGSLQDLWTGISQYGGSANRVTIVQGTMPNEEPQGPGAAINSAKEGVTAAAAPAK